MTEDGHEPYIPPELVARLVPGALVRIVISGERQPTHKCVLSADERDRWLASFDGQIGWIVPRSTFSLAICRHCGTAVPVKAINIAVKLPGYPVPFSFYCIELDPL